MRLDDDLLLRVPQQIGVQPIEQFRDHLGVIQDLKGDDALEKSWRISDDVGEVSIKRQQKRAKLLRHRNNTFIGRFGRKVITKSKNLMALVSKRLGDKIGNTMISEKSQCHQAVTVNSARSRA